MSMHKNFAPRTLSSSCTKYQAKVRHVGNGFMGKCFLSFSTFYSPTQNCSYSRTNMKLMTVTRFLNLGVKAVKMESDERFLVYILLYFYSFNVIYKTNRNSFSDCEVKFTCYSCIRETKHFTF